MVRGVTSVLGATALSLGFLATSAGAAEIMFHDFVATGDSTPNSALVNVNDNTAGFFQFTINLPVGEDGSLTGFYADFTGDVMFAESDIASSPDYECFESPGTANDGVCGNNQNLNGLGDLTFDFGLGYDFAGTPVVVTVADKGLSLSDVLAVGLRFQETGTDGEGSAKLYSSTTKTEVIPLPATALLLLGGIGGLGALRAARRKA